MATKAKLTKAEVQGLLLSLLGMAGIITRMTKTPKDDAVAGLLLTIVITPDLFDQLWAVFDSAQTPA